MCLGIRLTRYQAEIAEAIVRHKYVAVRSANAVGKTFLAAALAVWYIATHTPAYVVTTSASWVSQRKQLLPEVARIKAGATSAALRDLGKVLATEWQIAPHYGLFALSPVDPEVFAGYRPPAGAGTFVIVDEASSLSDEIYNAILGVVTSAESRVLLLGNPLRADGPFYRAFKSPNWRCFKVSAYDSPNVTGEAEGVPGLATAEWIEERRAEWGEASPMFKARVLGEFPEDTGQVLFPLSLLAEAVGRWENRGGAGEGDTGEMVRVGVDVARFGEDYSVIQGVKGRVAFEPERVHGADLMDLTGRVVEFVRRHGAAIVNVDEIGLGAGVLDRLREVGVNAVGVNFGAKARDADAFANVRAEAYHALAEWMRDGGAIPNDPRLQAGLAAVEYKYNSAGKLVLKDKEHIKAKLGYSPDEADALALAVYKPFTELRLI
jgi:hypothetical protein